MTTRFRAGDVISSTAWPGEYRVTDVGEHIVWADGIAAGGGVSVAVKRCTLLRRPLRVGDVLVHRNIGTYRVRDCDLGPMWDKAGWTHGDGTPIDVEAPAVEAKARPGEPLCDGCFGEGAHSLQCNVANAAKAPVEVGYLGDPGPQKRVIIDRTATSDVVRFAFPIGDTETYISFDGKLARRLGENGLMAWDAMAHEIRAMLEAVSFDQRNNRLSDECGALASANRELLVENAVLRRDVERLTRKARR